MKRNSKDDPINNRLTEEALRKSETNLRAIFNHIEYAVLLLDPSFRILSYNEIARLWGKSAFGIEMREGQNLFTLISEDLQIEHGDVLNAIRAGNSFDEEMSYTLIDGAIEWYRVRINPVYDEREYVGLCISAASITSRKM